MDAVDIVSSPLPEYMDTDVVASSPISARMDKDGSSTNSVSVSASPGMVEDSSLLEKAITLTNCDVNKECNRRKVEMVLERFEKMKIHSIKEHDKLRAENNELRTEAKRKDDLLKKQDFILSGQRDTIRTLHKLIKHAHLLNSQLRFEKNNGFNNMNRRPPQPVAAMTKTTNLMASRFFCGQIGSTSSYVGNSPTSDLSHSINSPNVRSPLVPQMSRFSHDRLPTPLIDISDENLPSVTAISPLAPPTRILIKIDQHFKKRDASAYVMPDGKLASPLCVPDNFKNRSMKSDIVKIRFPAIDRRDLEITGKIHGNIDYPKEAKFCRIFYYIQSCHSSWLNSASTPTRLTGCTKFTIEIPKELTKCNLPDRLIIFGIIETRTGSFYSERVMFPICDPVNNSTAPSVSSIIQEIQSRPAHSIIVTNLSGNNFKSITQSEQKKEVPTVRFIDNGDEYEIYRP